MNVEWGKIQEKETEKSAQSKFNSSSEERGKEKVCWTLSSEVELCAADF